MKKIVLIIILMLVMPVTTCLAVIDNSGENSVEFEYQDQLRASGADQLIYELPQGTRDLLERLGASNIDSDSVIAITPSTVINSIGELISSSAGGPIKSAAIIIGIILLCALMEGVKVSFGNSSLGGTFGVVSALAAGTAIILPVLGCIERAGEAIKSGSIFMFSYIPVFTGIITISGRPVTGSVYSVLLFGVAEVLSALSTSVLVPLLSIFLAFTLVSAVVPHLKLQKAAESMQKAASWILGIGMTIFVGLLSIQGVVGSAADTVTLKAAKFVAGSAIPVVGSAIGDAISSVQSCLGLLKSSVGAFGIIAIAALFLPVLIESILWQLALNICAAVGDLLGVTQLTGIIKGAATALKLLTVVILCSMLILIVSTTLILMMGMGS